MSHFDLGAAAFPLLRRALSRRAVLQGLVAAGAGGAALSLLAACGGGSSSTPTSAAAGTSAATSASGGNVITSGAPSSGGATPAGGTPASVAATPAAASTAAAAPANIKPGGKIVYAYVDEPDRLDPTRSTLRSAQIVFFSMFDCLIGRTPDNAYHPWLAEKWDVSSDGMSYTFNLKSGVKFHDGTPFNAAAVKYTMDRVHDPKSPTTLNPAAYGYYSTVETPDDNTAVIKLSKPWAPMLDAISFTYRPVSPTAGQKLGEDLSRNPVGTGPFKFKEWIPNDHITLVKNPDYNWGSPMFQHPGPAYLDEVTFRQVPEDATRVAALQNNEAQMITNLPPQSLDEIKSSPNFEVLIGFVPGICYGYTVNVRKPPTAELEVRQAMEYALNQEEICQTIFGPYQSLKAMTPNHGILVPTTDAYEPKAAQIYKPDPAKAQQLLEGAGWTMGPNGIRQKNGQPLEVLAATWEHGVVEVMQSQFRKVGIDLKITVGPATTANELARREQVHMSPLPSARSDPGILSSLHSRQEGGSGFNFTYHQNKQLDDLLDAGVSATDPKERANDYSQIQMIIMQQAMFMPIYNRDNANARRSTLKGKIIFDRGFFPYLNDVYLQQ